MSQFAELPTEYDDDILGYKGRYSDGVSQQKSVHSLIYPPIGFFPFYCVGNGDDYGFYWPIGGENRPPLVALSSHDASSLIPEHSSLDTLYACELACTDDDQDDLQEYRQLIVNATGAPPIDHELRNIAADDFGRLLELDPKSPYYLCAQGDVDLETGDTESAEQRYRQSLDQLPEYVAAHFGLAVALRRQRKGKEATVHLRKSLLGSLALYGGSFWSDTSLPGSFRVDWNSKTLTWLRGSRTVHESLQDDPLIRRIDDLSFATGLAQNPDLSILQSLVEQYADVDAYSEAAAIWQLIGEWSARETTSFRERYNLTPQTYGIRLAELLDLSQNKRRAKLVRSMLAAMEKPEGPHL